jgi:hypothetical protein
MRSIHFLDFSCRIPVDTPAWTVQDHLGNVIPSQVLPNLPAIVPYTEPSKYYIAIEATLPPLGYTTFLMQAAANLGFGYDSRASVVQQPRSADPAVDTVISNAAVELRFDATSGLLTKITNKNTGVSTALSQTWNYYESYQADVGQRSGAYIFRPATQNKTAACGNTPVVTTVAGAVLSEVNIVRPFCICGFPCIIVIQLNSKH